MGHKYTTLFRFVKTDPKKISIFSKNASLGSELTGTAQKTDLSVLFFGAEKAGSTLTCSSG